MRFPYGETVTLLKEARDRVGDVTFVYDGEVADCGYSPAIGLSRAHTREFGGMNSTVVTGRTLYLPVNSGLTATHRVEFADGTVWEVIGDVGPWRSPLTGWSPGEQAELKRVTG